MLKEFASLLTLELRPSAVFNYFWIVVHSLAVFAVVYASIHWYLQIFLLLLLALHFVFQRQAKNQPDKLIWLNGNDWRLYDKNNDDEYTQASLTPMSFLSSWLVILVLETENEKRVNVLVLFDSLDTEIFRRLKVRLTILKPALLKKLSAE